MISRLRGEVVDIQGQFVTLDVQGVGYEVYCSRAGLADCALGNTQELIIYTDVREDSIRLYGFLDLLEKRVFLLLKGVKGLAAKSAADLISQIDKRELLRTIGSGDVKKLQSLKGIGKKTAERIIVELKDKVGELASEVRPLHVQVEVGLSSPEQDALAALESLGFSRGEGEKAIASVLSQMTDTKLEAGELVKEALRFV